MSKAKIPTLEDRIAEASRDGARGRLLDLSMRFVHNARNELGTLSAGNSPKEFESRLNTVIVQLADARAFAKAAWELPKGDK